jgi:hypothetical protein
MLWIAKLIENKYVVYALAVVAVLLSLWGYGKWQYHSGYSTAEKDRYLVDLESFRLESLKLHDLSTTLQAQITLMLDAKPKIIERYNRVIIEKPLPAGCVIDTDRLRELNSAVEAANTRKPNRAMP